MKKIRDAAVTLSFVCALSILTACTVWNTRKWEELGNRDFIFAQFKYTHLNAGKKIALQSMREYPLNPVLKSLEKKYNIRIDASEFDSFLQKGDLSRIREEGVIMTNSYIWDCPAKMENRVEFEIKVNYGDDMRVMNYSYQVVLKVQGRVRAVFFDNVSSYEALQNKVLAHIGAGITMDGFTPKKNQDASADKSFTAMPGRRWETEGRIRDLMDDYMKTLTPENKKKFRDDMIRHLDEGSE